MFEKRVCAYYFRASAALENKTNHGRERNIRAEFYAFYIFLDVLGLIKRKSPCSNGICGLLFPART